MVRHGFSSPSIRVAFARPGRWPRWGWVMIPTTEGTLARQAMVTRATMPPRKHYDAYRYLCLP